MTLLRHEKCQREMVRFESDRARTRAHTDTHKRVKKDNSSGCDGNMFGKLYKTWYKYALELQAYSMETPVSSNNNPFSWWRDMGWARYPRLSEMAFKYPCGNYCK